MSPGATAARPPEPVEQGSADGPRRDHCHAETARGRDRSWTAQRAVERGLEIISEASRHIPDNIKTETSDMPWHQIAAIGNLLRHDYQRVESRLIWNIVTDHLPQLEAVVRHLMTVLARRDEP